MNIQSNQQQRINTIRQEVGQARQALEAVAAQDAFDYSEGRIVDKPFGDYSRGELRTAFWASQPTGVDVTSQDGSVELRSHTFPKEATGARWLAATVAANVGWGLMSVTGLGAGLAAWGMRKAVDGPGECLIERTEKSGGHTIRENIKIDEAGRASYTKTEA